MIESESASSRLPTEAVILAMKGDRFPSLDRTLTIARLGSREPGSLSPEDIKDLSRVMLMHYARMGIA